MIPFVLDKNGIDSLKKLKAHAEANPLTLEQIKETIDGKRQPIGDDPNFVCLLPFGFRVAYSIEQQKVDLRHLSMSLNGGQDKKFPSPYAVEMVMEVLGFKNKLSGCLKVWMEEELGAINVLDFFEK